MDCAAVQLYSFCWLYGELSSRFLSAIALTPSPSQLLSLAFPVVYAIPIFNVFGNLAHNWLWW
jgi:hypothetical protein